LIMRDNFYDFCKTREKGAWRKWCDENIGDFDLAVVLHLPHHQAHLSAAVAKQLLSHNMRIAFAMLDRHFLGTAHKRFKLRLPRFITLEHKHGVGWHAHVSLKLWRDAQGTVIDADAFKARLTQCWQQVCGQHGRYFAAFGVYVDEMRGDYLSYSLKQIGEGAGQGEVDVDNSAVDALLGQAAQRH